MKSVLNVHGYDYIVIAFQTPIPEYLTNLHYLHRFHLPLTHGEVLHKDSKQGTLAHCIFMAVYFLVPFPNGRDDCLSVVPWSCCWLSTSRCSVPIKLFTN